MDSSGFNYTYNPCVRIKELLRPCNDVYVNTYMYKYTFTVSLVPLELVKLESKNGWTLNVEYFLVIIFLITF